MASKPTSEIEIVNLALLQIHQAALTSLLDESSDVASTANRIVAPTRRGLLRNYIWNFAKKRDEAMKVTDKAPKFDYSAYYQMPDDMIRLLAVGKEEERAYPKRYDIEGRYILLQSTDNSVPITYISDVEDVSLWDALFVEVVALQVAVRLCMPITGDAKKKESLAEDLKVMLAEALAIDHQERPLDVLDYSRIEQARWGSSFGELGDYDLKVNWTSALS